MYLWTWKLPLKFGSRPDADRMSRVKIHLRRGLLLLENVTHNPKRSKEGYSSLQCKPAITATGTHMPYGITQCYLPPGRGDIPAFTPAEAGTRFSDSGGMQG